MCQAIEIFFTRTCNLYIKHGTGMFGVPEMDITSEVNPKSLPLILSPACASVPNRDLPSIICLKKLLLIMKNNEYYHYDH